MSHVYVRNVNLRYFSQALSLPDICFERKRNLQTIKTVMAENQKEVNYEYD